MDAGSSLGEQMSLELTRLHNNLVPIGDLQNPEILALFDKDEVINKTGETIKQFRERYPWVELKVVCGGWGSWCVRAIGQVVPPFGFQASEHLANVITQLLHREEFEFSETEVAILKLALRTSREEECENLVCFAIARIKIKEPIQVKESVSNEEAAEITAFVESLEWLNTDTETQDDMFLNQTVLKLPGGEKKKRGRLEDGSKEGNESKRGRKDRSICTPDGLPLTYSKEMGNWYRVFVDTYDEENGFAMPGTERARLRCWLYKAAMRIGEEAKLNKENVFVSVVSQNKFVEEANRWGKEQPSPHIGQESLNVFHLRPLLLTFLASKCVEPDFEVVIARDGNVYNTPSL